MIDAASIGRRAGGPPLRVGSVTSVDGGRLVVGITAAAVAMLPLLAPRGPVNIAPVDGIIALALSVSLFWAGTSGRRWRFAYTLPMGLFIAGGALGALAGPVPVGGLVALIQDFWLLAWCICIVNVCRTPKALGTILRTWAYSSLVWAMLLLIGELSGNAYLAGIQSNEGGRTSLTFGDANYSAHYFFVSMMIIAATRRPRHRLARVSAYMLLLPAWALSGSNSGIVELVLGITLTVLAAIYLRKGLPATIAAVCSLLVIGAVLVPRAPFARVQQAAHDSQYRVLRDWVGRSRSSAGQREQLLHESVALYYNSGPLGQGPTSTIRRLTTSQAPFAKEAHNDYLAALVERGFLGALAITLLFAGVLLRAWSVVRRPLSPAFANVLPSTGPLLGAIGGTLAFASVYEILHARHVWALFGVVAALYLWARE